MASIEGDIFRYVKEGIYPEASRLRAPALQSQIGTPRAGGARERRGGDRLIDRAPEADMDRRNERFAPGADHLPAVVGVHDVVCQGAPESTRSWRRFVLPLCLAATAFLASTLARLANGLQWVRRPAFSGRWTPRFVFETGRGGRTRTRDLRFWRLVAVSAMPAYLRARGLCAKTAGAWTGIILRFSRVEYPQQQ